MEEQIKKAEYLLNYKRVGFIEKNSIALLSVLLHKKGSLENIDLYKDLNISRLLEHERYSRILSQFNEPLENKAYIQLSAMKFDVECLLKKGTSISRTWAPVGNSIPPSGPIFNLSIILDKN